MSFLSKDFDILYQTNIVIKHQTTKNYTLFFSITMHLNAYIDLFVVDKQSI